MDKDIQTFHYIVRANCNPIFQSFCLTSCKVSNMYLARQVLRKSLLEPLNQEFINLTLKFTNDIMELDTSQAIGFVYHILWLNVGSHKIPVSPF